MLLPGETVPVAFFGAVVMALLGAAAYVVHALHLRDERRFAAALADAADAVRHTVPAANHAAATKPGAKRQSGDMRSLAPAKSSVLLIRERGDL